jgi:ribosomal protein S6
LNPYEAAYILDPDLSEEQLAATKADVRSKIEGIGATDVIELRSERRVLTYPIRKRTEGHYVVFRFQGPADSVSKLRLEFKHYEQILRMSYLRIPDKVAATPIPAAAPSAPPEAAAAPVEPVAPEPPPMPTPTPTPEVTVETESPGPAPI